jgi:hypothetical protein
LHEARVAGGLVREPNVCLQKSTEGVSGALRTA